jgi:hypothetical protein
MSGTEPIKTSPITGTRLVSHRRHNPTRIAEDNNRSEICRNGRRPFRHHAGGLSLVISTYMCVYSANATHFALHCQRKPCSAQKGGSKVRHRDVLLHVQIIWSKVYVYARGNTRTYGSAEEPTEMQSLQCTLRACLQHYTHTIHAPFNS